MLCPASPVVISRGAQDVVRTYVRTLLDAIDYMHERNCVHRDPKPENVLLSDRSEAAVIKIVDLGLSRFVDERMLMRTICGTHKYLAPELVQTDRGQLQGYDKAIDMCARCCPPPRRARSVRGAPWRPPRATQVGRRAADVYHAVRLQPLRS